ncbi:MAG: molecular chaperone HtpG [Clostridia bacterium]|nr:molecular chaperone HtpG [Clostridia bacterium]
MAEENNIRKGGITVETEHIFPIIKKWLYSEKEIFLREIVSNACDAVTKLRRLTSLGQISGIEDDYKIFVRADKANKTLTVSDNGIGMTGEEVNKYICQIALSGALDFISKYENESDSTATGIIGHFGLGFYSSFMVSDTVEVITKSYIDGEKPVRWVCGESGEFEIYDSDKADRGTDVIMHINEDEEEYLEEAKLRDILEKYCSFMPVEIYFENVGEEDGEEAKEGEEPKPGKGPILVNNTHPLWLKRPGECEEQEYKDFYSRVFRDYKEPLFHIHINADYPLNFKGILFFPKITNEYENIEGQVKLYYNQVFVADNIKEILPEYLLMLRGVIDCPELPLNVSRSYMQNDAYVRRMATHITKKVADKLNGMFNTEREKYEKIWREIKLFVEYASLRDNKFYDRIKDSILLELTDGSFVSVVEYLESAKETNDKTVYYCTDKAAQASYISLLEAEGIKVAVFDKPIDTSFASVVENDRGIKFLRVDSSVADAIKGEGEVYENEELSKLFEKIGGEGIKVSFENLKDPTIPAILNISEEERRIDDMMKMYNMAKGGESVMPARGASLILNSSSSLIRKLGDTLDEETARQVWYLAVLAQRQFTPDELKSFIAGSVAALERAMPEDPGESDNDN